MHQTMLTLVVAQERRFEGGSIAFEIVDVEIARISGWQPRSPTELPQ